MHEGRRPTRKRQSDDPRPHAAQRAMPVLEGRCEGVGKGRISQLVAEGLPVRSDGQIDVAMGLAWIEDNLDPSPEAQDILGTVEPQIEPGGQMVGGQMVFGQIAIITRG